MVNMRIASLIANNANASVLGGVLRRTYGICERRPRRPKRRTCVGERWLRPPSRPTRRACRRLSGRQEASHRFCIDDIRHQAHTARAHTETDIQAHTHTHTHTHQQQQPPTLPPACRLSLSITPHLLSIYIYIYILHREGGRGYHLSRPIQ